MSAKSKRKSKRKSKPTSRVVAEVTRLDLAANYGPLVKAAAFSHARDLAQHQRRTRRRARKNAVALYRSVKRP